MTSRRRNGQFTRPHITAKMFTVIFLTSFLTTISLYNKAFPVRQIQLISPVGAYSVPETKETPRPMTLRQDIKNIICSKDWDCDLAVKIATCESGLNTEAINLNKGHSLDRGLWQINAKYHPNVSSVCAFDAKCSTDAAYRIYKEQGRTFNAWYCSKKV